MLKASAKSPPEIRDYRQSTAGEIGQTLCRTREARDEDLAYVSDLLRIRIDYLAALEEGELGRLPGRPYALGYLRSYGNHLGLNGDELVGRLKETTGYSFTPPALSLRPPVAPPVHRPHRAVMFCLLLGAGMYASYYAVFEQERDAVGGSGAPPAGAARTPIKPAPSAGSDRLSTAPQANDSYGTVSAQAAVDPASQGRSITDDVAAPLEAARARELLPLLEASEEPIPSASGEAREVTGGPVPAAPSSGTAVDREQPMAPATTVAVKPAVSSGDQSISAATTPVPPAGRFAVHVALVRNAADAAGEWQRLARRYSSLADLPVQTPRPVEVSGKGTFYRVLGGEFTTRAEARAVCDRVRSEGGGCNEAAL
jgi:cytoskeleton protein RodZ